jgi:hypothetical protein
MDQVLDSTDQQAVTASLVLYRCAVPPCRTLMQGERGHAAGRPVLHRWHWARGASCVPSPASRRAPRDPSPASGMTQRDPSPAHGMTQRLPSPACGRRWPEGPDEGRAANAARNASPHAPLPRGFATRPSPALRAPSPARRRERGDAAGVSATAPIPAIVTRGLGAAGERRPTFPSPRSSLRTSGRRRAPIRGPAQGGRASGALDAAPSPDLSEVIPGLVPGTHVTPQRMERRRRAPCVRKRVGSRHKAGNDHGERTARTARRSWAPPSHSRLLPSHDQIAHCPLPTIDQQHPPFRDRNKTLDTDIIPIHTSPVRPEGRSRGRTGSRGVDGGDPRLEETRKLLPRGDRG